LVTDLGKEEEAITRLSRVGFDHILGHLKGGFEAWKISDQEVDAIERIDASTFASRANPESDLIIDVRKETEYGTLHVKNAENKPLADLNNWSLDLNPNQHFYLHCAGGYRSMIAASILQARGYRNFTEVEGGFGAIKQTNIAVTDKVNAVG
jgi:hydroxyacylglutathione hydrolase